MNEVITKGLIIWPDDVGRKMERPRYKTYYNPSTEKPKPTSSWIETPTGQKNKEQHVDEYELNILSTGMNQEGGKVLQQIFGSKVFAYPKPTSLISSLIRAATKNNDLVLDSFSGSGTTGHATLHVNKQDKGNRRFILVEMETNIAQQITAERIRRIIEGYKNSKGEPIDGLGGGFRYCELGQPLFDEDGKIRETVIFSELARHVYFSETGEPLPKERVPKSPLIGSCRGVGIYLLYNGILHDKKSNGGNVLTRNVLANLPQFEGLKVIYCTGCLLGKERLQAENIIVRQIPYEICVS